MTTIDHIADDAAAGIYNRVNFSDGRFLALQPLYYGACLIMGYTRPSGDKVEITINIGIDDASITRFYNLFFDLLLAGIPFYRLPRTKYKPAYRDQVWEQLLLNIWHRHPSGVETAHTTPFKIMFERTVRPMIAECRRINQKYC